MANPGPSASAKPAIWLDFCLAHDIAAAEVPLFAAATDGGARCLVTDGVPSP